MLMPALRSLFGIIALLPSLAVSQSPRTRIVMLGTGTPIPDPERSGPGVAIVVDSMAYLFDAGTGVVRRAAAAGRNGVQGFAARTVTAQPAPRFERLFLTHLHSDHTSAWPTRSLRRGSRAESRHSTSRAARHAPPRERHPRWQRRGHC
jgi:ribonuclease BN (tRNA processing enzyme)